MQFRARVLHLIGDVHALRPIIDGLLAVHQEVGKQQEVLAKRVRGEAKTDATTRRLMNVLGIGVVTAMRSATLSTIPRGSDRFRQRVPNSA